MTVLDVLPSPLHLLVTIILASAVFLALTFRSKLDPISKRITARESSTTYRVRGIPLDWDLARLQAEIDQPGRAFAADNVIGTAKSLVPTIGGKENEATVVFLGQRRSSLPRIGGFMVDKDFYGLTTLFAPASEDHKIE